MGYVKVRFKLWERERRHPLLVWLAARVYRWVPLCGKDLWNIPRLMALRKELTVKRSADEWYSFISNGFRGGYRPLQVQSEITALMALLENRRAKRMLEIGTARGGTLFLLCRVIQSGGTIISVDLPAGWFGGGYPPWRRLVYPQFAGKGCTMHLLREDSHSQETVDKVAAILGDEKLDFVLVDGDHTYAGVKRDFELYLPLLKEGGILAFHDIVPHSDQECQVDRLWSELREKYEHIELVEDWKQDYGGIGVLLNAWSSEAGVCQ